MTGCRGHLVVALTFVVARLEVEGGDILASAEVARGVRQRTRGLLGRDRKAVTGALVLRPCRQVHTIGMRFPIDVAFCDRDGVVLRTLTVAPWRGARGMWPGRGGGGGGPRGPSPGGGPPAGTRRGRGWRPRGRGGARGDGAGRVRGRGGRRGLRPVAAAAGRHRRGQGVTPGGRGVSPRQERREPPETVRPAVVLVGTPIGNLGDLSPRAVEALAA